MKPAIITVFCFNTGIAKRYTTVAGIKKYVPSYAKVYTINVYDGEKFGEVVSSIDFNKVFRLKVYNRSNSEWIEYLQLKYPNLQILIRDESKPIGLVTSWSIC